MTPVSLTITIEHSRDLGGRTIPIRIPANKLPDDYVNDLGRSTRVFYRNNPLAFRFQDSRKACFKFWCVLPAGFTSGESLRVDIGHSVRQQAPSPRALGGLRNVINFSDPYSVGSIRGRQVVANSVSSGGITANYQHNPQLLRDTNGNIVLFFQGGPDADELTGNKYIFRTIREKGKRTWSSAQLDLFTAGSPNTNRSGKAHQMPAALFKRSDGRTVIVFTGHNTGGFTGAQLYTAVSTNPTHAVGSANDWIYPLNEILGSGAGGQMLMNQYAFRMSNGEWAMTGHNSAGGTYLVVTPDEGSSWQIYPIGGSEPLLCNEGATWEVPGDKGHLICHGRVATSTGPAAYMVSESFDFGRSWTTWAVGPFASGQSRPEALVLTKGPNAGKRRVVICLNEVMPAVGLNWGSRNNLAVLISEDGGVTWSRRLSVEDRWTDAYAYPTLLETDEGGLLVAYSVNKLSTWVAEFTPDEVKSSNHTAQRYRNGARILPDGSFLPDISSTAVYADAFACHARQYPLYFTVQIWTPSGYQGGTPALVGIRASDKQQYVAMSPVWNTYNTRVYPAGNTNHGGLSNNAEHEIGIMLKPDNTYDAYLNGAPIATSLAPWNGNNANANHDNCVQVIVGPNSGGVDRLPANQQMKIYSFAAVVNPLLDAVVEVI